MSSCEVPNEKVQFPYPDPPGTLPAYMSIIPPFGSTLHVGDTFRFYAFVEGPTLSGFETDGYIRDDGRTLGNGSIGTVGGLTACQASFSFGLGGPLSDTLTDTPTGNNSAIVQFYDLARGHVVNGIGITGDTRDIFNSTTFELDLTRATRRFDFPFNYRIE